MTTFTIALPIQIRWNCCSLGRILRRIIGLPTEPISDDLLKKHHCCEAVDNVPGDPETTAFKKFARLHHALWRENHGLEIGTEPMHTDPNRESRALGSRIALSVAKRTGANFLTDAVRCAVKDRLANPQPHQMLNEDRLFCDLLSSMPMCFNLFAGLQADIGLANRALRQWWPDVPGRVSALMFEWSPGRRCKGEYLENRSAFDVAFMLDLGAGALGVLGVETKYHEHCKKQSAPRAERLKRYTEITQRSGIMPRESISAIIGTDLQQIWLDHLLAASMPLHESRKWTWAGFALVHPARNPSYARAMHRYRSYLVDPRSARVSTIESLLDADVLPGAAAAKFRERYLW